MTFTNKHIKPSRLGPGASLALLRHREPQLFRALRRWPGDEDGPWFVSSPLVSSPFRLLVLLYQ